MLKYIIRPIFNYRTLPPEVYFINQRDANATKRTYGLKLGPLPRMNIRDADMEIAGDSVTLVGAPYGPYKPKDRVDAFTKINIREHPDLIMVQVDPSAFIARSRYSAYKCALQGVEGYEKKDIEILDPIKPYDWEECVVNLTVLDMIVHNKNFEKVDWTKGLSTYNYEELQDKSLVESNKALFVDCIDKHIFNGKYSEYNLINQVTYTALMGKHKVMLGDMPETLYKINIGNTLEIQEARDIFKFVLQKIKQMEVPISMKQATLDFLPHIFQAPRDLYMTGLLRKSFVVSETTAAYIANPHVGPISEYWEPPPQGISFQEASRIPSQRPGETSEHQIEKQAILDVLLETYTWSEPYLSNPFPYLVQDITKVSPQELNNMKSCFLAYYQKYSSFKDELQKQLPHFKNNSELRYLEYQYDSKVKYEQYDINSHKDRDIKQIKRLSMSS